MTGARTALPLTVEAELERLLEPVQGATRVSGGDINEAFRVELRNRLPVFVKLNRSAPWGLFDVEAKGLEWLRAAGAIRVPEVLAVSSADAEVPFLVLELLESAPQQSQRFDEELGHGLANLHRTGAPGFGLDHDNFIGSVPQSNRSHTTWAEFYRSERLAPLLERTIEAGRATPELRRGMNRVMEGLPELVGPDEPPARLHGDLWGGNLHSDERGLPALLDPAVYGGHREIDLAMMQLFGGFSGRVFEAYRESWPLADGWRERTPLYQLYPLLVHVVLFGGSYIGSVERALARVSL